MSASIYSRIAFSEYFCPLKKSIFFKVSKLSLSAACPVWPSSLFESVYILKSVSHLTLNQCRHAHTTIITRLSFTYSIFSLALLAAKSLAVFPNTFIWEALKTGNQT